jgi:prepilin-type N-terminal cleavage/methylation domain-containing protein
MRTSKIKFGFTLIEMIVSITIFSTFVGVISSSYIYIMNTLNDAEIVKDINADILSTVESITDDIKVSKIDYDCYSAEDKTAICNEIEVNTPNENVNNGYLVTKYLALQSHNGLNRVIYRVNKEKIQVLRQVFDSENNIWKADYGFSENDEEPFGFKNVNGEQIKVNDAWFYITPYKNPFDSSSLEFDNLQYQPQVTLRMEFKGSSQIRQNITIPIQTTVTIK